MLIEYNNTGEEINSPLTAPSGQTFTIGTLTPDVMYVLSHVKLLLNKVSQGQPTEILSVAIFATSGGLPTGVPLSIGTISSDDITYNSWEWYQINMNSYDLEPSTKYALVLDSVNTVQAAIGATDSYPGGDLVYYMPPWMAFPYDLQFEVYGGIYPSIKNLEVNVSDDRIKIGVDAQKELEVEDELILKV